MKNIWSNLALATTGKYDPDYTSAKAMSDLQERLPASTGITTSNVPSLHNSRLARQSTSSVNYHRKPLVVGNRSFMNEYELHRSNIADNPNAFVYDMNRILTALG